MDYTPYEDTRSNVLTIWKQGQCHLNKFWKSWLTEYLPSLRERFNTEMKPAKGEVDRTPNVGEIVIVKEEDFPRGKWKIAKIIKVIDSESDGLQRGVKLRYPSGRITNRPFRLIYPLECDDRVEQPKMQSKIKISSVQKKTEDQKPTPAKTRPVRNAADVARSRIRMQCNEISVVGV